MNESEDVLLRDSGLIGYYGLNNWFDSLSNGDKKKLRFYYEYLCGIEIYFYKDENGKPHAGATDAVLNDPISLELGAPEIPMTLVNNEWVPQTCYGFLSLIAFSAREKGDLDFLEKIYKKIIQLDEVELYQIYHAYTGLLYLSYHARNTSSNGFSIFETYVKSALSTFKKEPLYRHYLLEIIAQFYYWQRDIIPGTLNKCIQYSKEDIKNIELTIDSLKKELKARMQQIIKKGTVSPNPMLPDNIATYNSIKRLAIIYEKQSRLNDAIKLCDIGIRYEFDDGTKRGYHGRKERLIKKLEKRKNE